ncbi:MAG: WYL domain-containing protein [Clostridia bacterium]|nr:WYL domain-containing protein [Clostridia bacterium]
MARAANQKLKILYLLKMLMEQTDEEHPLSMTQILAQLENQGIRAERKSVYDDIEALRLYGLDILMTKGKTAGYYVAARDFEVPEVKLLVDSVLASQFITERKTRALVKKLGRLCSVHEAKQMHRQVYVANRIKHMNESIYYSVDKVHTAIQENRQISFRYYEYTMEGKRRYRRNGARYIVSPYGLLWNNENYYLIAYDAEAALFKNYRVDKMEGIGIEQRERLGREEYQTMDMNAYAQRLFSMFGGRDERVTIRFHERLAGVVHDRFGSISFEPDGDTHFLIRATVTVSQQFFAWMVGLGTDAQLLAPADVVSEMSAYVHAVAAMYE